ncbi:MAG TPA: DnaJ domain-containing protein [Solirubrobacteraceae bacterium]|nr:DnaJ domain-containing protein [Solirubrobacteraceae bacterium]
MASDPYQILGITPTATDDELRTAYRGLVQLHHPDHNNGSRESALRFAEVQEAYAHVRLLRKQADTTRTTGPTPGPTGTGPEVEARLRAMENELRAAREQREKAAREAAEEAARATAATADAATRATRKATGYDEQGRATDEELGYYSTDDSFAKILDDFADQVSTRFAEAHPPTEGRRRKPRSVADWIDELGSRLTGDSHRKQDE